MRPMSAAIFRPLIPLSPNVSGRQTWGVKSAGPFTVGSLLQPADSTMTSESEQPPCLCQTRRRLASRAGRHPRQRHHMQPAELLPTPTVLFADRVVVLLCVQRSVLADGVLPQLGEDSDRIVT